jgi:hypothetical protein
MPFGHCCAYAWAPRTGSPSRSGRITKTRRALNDLTSASLQGVAPRGGATCGVEKRIAFLEKSAAPALSLICSRSWQLSTTCRIQTSVTQRNCLMPQRECLVTACRPVAFDSGFCSHGITASRKCG